MQVDTLNVVNRVVSWQRAEMPCWWVTVLATHGGSPAPVGSVFALNEAEEAVGSIGSPALTRVLAQRLIKHTPRTPVDWVFGADATQARALDFPVGADPVTVRVEPVRPEHRDGFAAMAQLLGARCSAERDSLSGAVREVPPQSAVLPDGRDAVVYHPPWRLLLSGAAPVTVAVADVAPALHFECVVFEPRAPYRAAWPRRAGLADVRLVSELADSVASTLDAKTAVLALAHDPAVDDPLLWLALDTPVFLVGALGSRANHAARLERLALRGASADALARIEGPVGLDIRSRTPAEIGVAILAQLIAARAAGA